jgi:hypothetical protein
MPSLFSGEGSIEKRKSNLEKIRALSPTAKRIDFRQLDPASFSMIEKVALKEARANAATSGHLFKSKSTRDDAGRRIVTYEGDISVWLNHHKRTGYSARINTDVDTHFETVKVRDGQRVIVTD